VAECGHDLVRGAPSIAIDHIRQTSSGWL
jgi:hypothetical protein